MNDTHLKLTPEAEVVARIARESIDPKLVMLPERTHEAGTPLLVVPAGAQLVNVKPHLDAWLPAPERRKGTAVLVTLESWIAHVNRHKDADSVIFADPDEDDAKLICVYDYNIAGPARVTMEKTEEKGVQWVAEHSRARFGEHRAVYEFPFSTEWQRWKANDGKPMSQAEFALFLEDRIAEVAEPLADRMGTVARDFLQRVGTGLQVAPPARLLQIARDFSVHAEEKVRTAVNLQTGESVVQYESVHADQQGTQLKVPGAFLLHLPVFKLGSPYEVVARLRYRLAGGRVSWVYTLYRTDLILNDAFTEAFKKAQESTGLPLFQGAPE